MAISDRIAVFNNGLIEQIGTPQEVYRAPKTEFAAKFVGDINEIDGQKLNVQNQELRLSKRVYVRPEKMHLRASRDEVPQGVVSFAARLVNREFLGAATKFVLDADGLKLNSLTFYHGDLQIGQNVWVWFYTEDMTVL